MKLQNILDNNHWVVDVASTAILPISLGLVLYSPDITDETYKRLWNHVWFFCLFLLILSCALLIATKFTSYKNKDTICNLKEELKSCKDAFDTPLIYEIFTGYLYAFSSGKLGFGTRGENSERITLYIHDNTKSYFIPFSRVSQNPLYKAKGRSIYPDNVGCIGKAWENGWHFDNKFPEDNCEYLKYSKLNYGMKHAEVNSLAMKSKLFACLRVESEGDQLGIIVVESTEPDRYSESEIKNLLQSQIHYVSSMLKKWHHLVPRIVNTKELGV